MAKKARASSKPLVALVTGGAGFLGSHLCERLLSEGYRVVCMDNLRTGSLENLVGLEGEANFEYVEHDVSSHINFSGELDEIYHFASPNVDARTLAAPERFWVWEPRVLIREGLRGTSEWFGGRSERVREVS